MKRVAEEAHYQSEEVEYPFKRLKCSDENLEGALVWLVIREISNGNEYYNLELYDEAINIYDRVLKVLFLLGGDWKFYEMFCYYVTSCCLICKGDFQSSADRILHFLGQHNDNYESEVYKNMLLECKKDICMMKAFFSIDQSSHSELVGEYTKSLDGDYLE